MYGVHVGAVSNCHIDTKSATADLLFDFQGIMEDGSRRTFIISVMLEASLSMAFVSRVLQESTNPTTFTKVCAVQTMLFSALF